MAGTIVPHLADCPAAYAQALAALERDTWRRRPAWAGWLSVALLSAGLLAGLDAVLPLLPDHDGTDAPFAASAATTAEPVVILASPSAAPGPAHAKVAARKGAPHRAAG
jgi:hypothetical protein